MDRSGGLGEGMDSVGCGGSPWKWVLPHEPRVEQSEVGRGYPAGLLHAGGGLTVFRWGDELGPFLHQRTAGIDEFIRRV